MTYEQLCQAVNAFRVMQPTRPLHLHITPEDAASLQFCDGNSYTVEGERVIVHVEEAILNGTAVLGMDDLRKGEKR